jgi:hypothetical protein
MRIIVFDWKKRSSSATNPAAFAGSIPRRARENDIIREIAFRFLPAAMQVNRDFIAWGLPDNCRDPMRGVHGAPHGFGGPPDRGGALFVMADGSVRLIAENTDAAVLHALSTPHGGKPTTE